jgi:cellobiose phosphorylase
VSMPEQRMFANPYGYFTDEGAKFVITDTLTPRPWINVLSNDRYGLVISQAGGGFSWADNCQLFRISRWEQDLSKDEYGRFLYVCDLDETEEIWSTTYQPTKRKAPGDEVRHELGATEFHREFLELRTKHTVFVPADDCVEVWLVEVENLSDRVRKLRLGAYLEWHLGGIGDWHREFHRLFMESRSESNVLMAWKHPGLVENKREQPEATPVAFLAWNGVPKVSWVTDKTAWLGRGGDLSAPAALRQVPPPSQTPRWDDPVGASVVDIELKPGEMAHFTIVIGAAEEPATCVALAEKYSARTAETVLQETTARWRERCNAGAPASDEPAVAMMARTWLPYQAIAGRLWAKCAYYQQGGAYGYRDQLQDSLMLLDSEPAATLVQLGKHAEAMYEDGGVRHWWHPETQIFVESRHSDTCLWLAYGVLEYLEATGDYSALERAYGFLSRETQRTGGVGSLWEHCLRGIDRALGRMSVRGLPLIGAGDWNDGLSHVGLDGKGESVWMAMFLFDILTRWQPHLVNLGSLELAAQFAGVCEALKAAVNRYGWDGEWYIAGTRDDGMPFGSSSCDQGKIFLNPQTWAVISGIAPLDRQEAAMESVRRHLLTDFGALLLQPAYSRVDPYIGYITRYAPGLRENGGVYSHASTWAVQAFSMFGDKQTAKQIYLGMLPPLRSAANADLYAAEPYVMPGNIDGPDSPYAGRAGWTWYTGSAAWMRRIVKYLS